MITADYTRTMARYSAWQNSAHIQAMATLSPAALTAPRGAFFETILATANHLLWGDTIWLHRFAGTPQPARGSIAESPEETPDFDAYRAARGVRDAEILDWTEALTDAGLSGTLSWHSGALGRQVEKQRAVCVAHFFNHQTHHRGQILAMLTAAGARPGDTDLFAMPGDYSVS